MCQLKQLSLSYKRSTAFNYCISNTACVYFCNSLSLAGLRTYVYDSCGCDHDFGSMCSLFGKLWVVSRCQILVIDHVRRTLNNCILFVINNTTNTNLYNLGHTHASYDVFKMAEQSGTGALIEKTVVKRRLPTKVRIQHQRNRVEVIRSQISCMNQFMILSVIIYAHA